MHTLLLIDDDESLRQMLAEFFELSGYRVIAAGDGEQGVRLARAHRPDLILSDVRMPGLNGHQALAELRRSPGLEATPVILMTGNADLPDMRRGMTLGADDYVPKPFDHAELLNTVRQHIERADQRRVTASTELHQLRRNLGALLPSDLVEPIHEIIGCASVLEVDASLMPADDIRDFARNIISSAETLNRRFENFVLFSRLEAGQFTTAIGPAVAVDHLVRHAAEPVAQRHRRADRLRFNLAPLQAPVARELLAKIVAELVDNACRYAIKTEPIDVNLTVTADQFAITIADYGMGIPPEKVEALTTGDAGTTGYGLNLSRRLTEIIGGTWTLDNRPKRGVAITLTFPRPAA